jgi:hypothetical protein
MANAVLINNERAVYSENILPYFATFNDPFTINIVSGGANAVVEQSTSTKYKGQRGIKITHLSTGTCIFSAQSNELETSIGKDGNYVVSARFLVPTDDDDSETTFSLLVYVNGLLIPATDFIITINDTAGTEFGKWNTFSQTLPLENGDVVDFQFKTTSDKIGSELYFDGLKLELNDRNLTAPSIYTEPKENITGWCSKVDTTNDVNLLANTLTAISFNLGTEQNNGASLLDTNAKVIPTALNDAMQVDFACTIETPAGSSNWFEIFFMVDSVVFGSQLFPLLKGSGNDHDVRVSFGVPVGSDFFTNGGQFYVKSNVAVTIKNRYIAVQRNHKGIN